MVIEQGWKGGIVLFAGRLSVQLGGKRGSSLTVEMMIQRVCSVSLWKDHLQVTLKCRCEKHQHFDQTVI